MFLIDAELGESTKKAGKTKSGKTGKIRRFSQF